jgi:hypothetical protein
MKPTRWFLLLLFLPSFGLAQTSPRMSAEFRSAAVHLMRVSDQMKPYQLATYADGLEAKDAERAASAVAVSADERDALNEILIFMESKALNNIDRSELIEKSPAVNPLDVLAASPLVAEMSKRELVCARDMLKMLDSASFSKLPACRRVAVSMDKQIISAR